MKKEFLAVTSAERLRLSEERARARRRAQAEALRVIARLEVEEEARRREDALRDAEVDLARFGDIAEPIKRSWLAKVLRGADIVVMGRSELEALVAARREQLERLRTVEGPERIKRADDLARLLAEEAGPARLPAEPAHVPIAVVEGDALAESPAAPSKRNGRPARSPFG